MSAYEFSSMTSLKSLTFSAKLFYVLVLGLFVAILMRNSALYPSIFADEYYYSSASRLFPLSQAPIANYLYLLIYRSTNFCGDGFLSCARILNVAFYILACPFIYQTAKRVSSKSIARYVAVLAILGPINIYTANFMPESMYFLAFWIYVWYILGLNSSSPLKSWFLVGIIVGLCMLIKPHGGFLIPPALLYLYFLFAQKSPFEIRKFLCVAFAIIFGALICKLVLGFLVAGVAGLSLLGPLYHATTQDFFNATAAVKGVGNLTELAANKTSLTIGNDSNAEQWGSGLLAVLNYWGTNICGHIIGLYLLFGVPLLVVFRLLGPSQLETKSGEIQRNYAYFIFFTLLFLVLVSSLYSSLVALSSNGGILRMHMRYYNFTFPLLLMLLPFASKESSKQPNFLGILLWVLACFTAGWGIWQMMAPYQPTAIDMPELRGLMQYRWVFYAVSGLGLCSLLIWPIFRQYSTKIFLWLVAPLLLIMGSIGVNRNIWESSKSNVYDRAGIVIKNILSKEEISKLVVVGDNPIELSRILFQLDQPNVTLQVIKGDTVYDRNLIPSGAKSILLMDNHSMSNKIKNQIHFDGYTLAGGDGDIKIDFHNHAWPSKDLLYIKGFFVPPESWGTWTIDRQAVLVFSKALPQEFVLKITARAFGPNIDRPIGVGIGELHQFITLRDHFQEVALDVKNPQRSNRLEINIPHLRSPKELGLGDDDRKLGIAISELKVSW